MLTSPKGKQMIEYISPIYANSEIEQAIYQAIGSEFDSADELAEEVLMQLHPQTATWGISFWEQRLKLPINESEDIKIRRRKVIARLQSKASTMTPERMGIILKTYIGSYVGITENVAPYTFSVDIINNTERFKLKDFTDIVNRIKPSHLAYIVGLIERKTLQIKEECKEYPYNFFMCGTFLCGTKPEIENLGFKVDTTLKAETNNTNTKQKYNMAGTFESGVDKI